MKNRKSRKGAISTTLVGSIARVLASMLAGIVIALLAGGIFLLNLQPDLSVWHTAELEDEFTTESKIHYFGEYLALEERLFKQLDEAVYAQIRPEEKHAINRFHKGSLADPDQWPINWNRSFEMPVTRPVAGVLLLHGLSDSPYSLRSLGEKLSKTGIHVLGLRIPGHGTAPSGLVNVKWEDMAAAVVLSMHHLKETLGDRPLYMVGYSNGGALAVQYMLSTLDTASLPRTSGVVLISPEIGVAKVAALAVWQGRIGRLLGLPKLAWNSVLPEYDPYKYNSFAVNAGDQAHRLTSEIQGQISRHAKSGGLSDLPPILAFQSVVDATVRAPALIEGLFNRLPQGNHELVLFDINRLESGNPLVNFKPLNQIYALLDKPTLPYSLAYVSNQTGSTRKVAVTQKNAASRRETILPLSSTWPAGVYSLSHIALPFSPDDPLYGGDAAGESPGIQLGNVVLRGEKGALRINPTSLLRMHWNPFYDYLEQRVVNFIQ